MFFNRRRDCPELEADAASVPTLTSRGLAVALAVRLPGVAVAVVDEAAVDVLAADVAGVRLAEADRATLAFSAVAFVARLARTGRSLMALTSLIIEYLTLPPVR
jgi:hypothetical protein